MNHKEHMAEMKKLQDNIDKNWKFCEKMWPIIITLIVILFLVRILSCFFPI